MGGARGVEWRRPLPHPCCHQSLAAAPSLSGPAAALAPPATMWKRSAEKEEMETIAIKIIAKVKRLRGEPLVEGDEEEALAVIGEAEQLKERRISCPVITAET